MTLTQKEIYRIRSHITQAIESLRIFQSDIPTCNNLFTRITTNDCNQLGNCQDDIEECLGDILSLYESTL